MSEREFDLVLMGATGFTGRLVAEHLLVRHGAIAETGVDVISIGALTHSAPCLDLGLDAA